MKLLCALILQLVSLACAAATTQGPLLITVTVVRSAPVTIVQDGAAPMLRNVGQLPQEPQRSANPDQRFRHVLVDY
jgi:hypothetical protein